MRTPGPVRDSTRRGRREHHRRFQVVLIGEVNSLSDAQWTRPRGVLLLVALLLRRRPDIEDWEQLLFVDGATRLTGFGPVAHPPHEPPFDLQRKGSGGGGRTRGTRRGLHVELCGGDAGGTANRERHPRPFLRKSPETAEVRKGPQDDWRTDDRTGAPQCRVREGHSRLARRCRRRRRGRTVTCGTTTPEWSQRISSAITPNNTKSAS